MKKKICALLLFGLCLFFIFACGNKVASDDTGDEARKQIGFKEFDEVVSTEEERSDSTSEDTESKDTDESEELVDGMRPEFKEAMDSYEAFYDEYCDIIKKYTENPSDMKLLADYTDMLTKSAEMAEKFDAWKNSDMNSAELKYYLDVNNRVTQKLLEVSE